MSAGQTPTRKERKNSDAEIRTDKKSYDGVEILKEMNLEIEDGEIVSILGPSGCGKTTLLNLILGITEADSGKIWFNGEDITNLAMEKEDSISCFRTTHYFRI